VQITYSLTETCETWDESCPAKQLWRLDAEQKRAQGILPTLPNKQVIDEKGFTTCNFCGKQARGQLKQCPECGKFFKGPRPYKPRNIDYECEACE
jgi:ssDNA-binding Zn-finger/Zn-ribbon topoisomerase 1